MYALKNDKIFLCMDKFKYIFEAIIHIILTSIPTVLPIKSFFFFNFLARTKMQNALKESKLKVFKNVIVEIFRRQNNLFFPYQQMKKITCVKVYYLYNSSNFKK